MKKRAARLLSLLLCLLLLLSAAPVSAAAADDVDAGEEAVSNASTKYRALLIGEYRFPPSVEQDGVAARMKGDVLQMKKLLSSARGGKGGKYSVTYRYNRTNAQIHSLINSTFKGAKSTDVSLFFISTHGVVGEPKTSPFAGALLTVNSQGKNLDYLQLGTLASWLKDVPGKVIVIISSCSSGSAIVKDGQIKLVGNGPGDPAAFDNAVIKTFARADEHINDGTVGNGGPFRKNKFYVLTASKHDETSWGWERYDDSASGSYNFMTYYMREGVSGKKPADSNKNKKITLAELRSYVSKKCAKACRTTRGVTSIQHVQAYPANSGFVVFR